MSKLFDHDAPVMQLLILIGNLIVLNTLWLICCIPVITAGAATTAVYYTMYQYATDGTEAVFKPFFRAFKKDFKQSTLVWLALLVIGFVLLCDIWFLSSVPQFKVLWILLGILLLLFTVALTHIFAILGRFDTNIKTALKSCYLVAIMNFPRSLLVLLLSAAPILICIFMPYQVLNTLPLWVGLAFGMIFYLNAKLFLKSFDKVAPKGEVTQQQQIES